MSTYHVNFFKCLLSSDGHPFKCLHGKGESRRGRFFVEGGAMNFIEIKCNRYKRILASSVPKLSQLRPVIVRWSTLLRPRLGA